MGALYPVSGAMELTAEFGYATERLRGENTALPGLCQAVGITIRWLMRFLVARCAALPDHLSVPPAAAPWEGSLGRLEVEADAMVSGVTTKATTSWGWIAMDTQTRHIMAFHVGDRRHERAKPLWAPLPAVSRVWVTFATDQSPVYTGIMPAAQHQAITTQARTTPPLERFTNTMRQRISRLVRDTLAFATPLAHPLGAITSFLCHSHRTRAAAFLVEHDP